MSLHSAKAIPFIVLALTGIFMAVDMFTEFEITDQMITLTVTILTPLGLGGLVNKGWNTYKAIKETPEQIRLRMDK